MLKMHDAELNAFQAQIYKMCHAAFSISAERKKEHLPADWVNQNARVVSGKHNVTCIIAYMHFQCSMKNANWSYFSVTLY